MSILLPILAVSFAAFCVWLTVRILNRRERWAKWTLAALIVLPTLYVLSTGPALWLWGGDQKIPEWLFAIYWPIRAIPDGPDLIEDAFVWYLDLWGH